MDATKEEWDAELRRMAEQAAEAAEVKRRADEATKVREARATAFIQLRAECLLKEAALIAVHFSLGTGFDFQKNALSVYKYVEADYTERVAKLCPSPVVDSGSDE